MTDLETLECGQRHRVVKLGATGQVGVVVGALRKRGGPIEIVLAAIALLIGTAVYIFDRGGAVGFVPSAWAAALRVRPVFGTLGGSLPTFTHTFGFALLFVALLRPRATAAVAAVCAGWTLVEAVFEIGQIPRVAALVDSWAGAARETWPLRLLLQYLASGTFALADLVSVVLGGALAYIVALHLRPVDT